MPVQSEETYIYSPLFKFRTWSCGRQVCVSCCSCCGMLSLLMVLFVVICNLTQEPLKNETALFLDGWTQTPVPRKLIKGPAAELLYKYQIGEAGMEIVDNGTAVFIPFIKHFQGTFARDTHATKTHEYGIANQLWVPNPFSVFGPKAVFGAIEKNHVLSHKGPWSTARLDRAKLEREQRWSVTNWWARIMQEIRSTIAHMFVFTKTNLFMAFWDESLLQNSADTIVKIADAVPKETLQRVNDMGSNMDIEEKELSHPEYESSSLNCIHFDNSTSIKITDHGAYVSLGQMLVVHRGQSIFAPRLEFSLSTGAGIFQYDKDKEEILLYLIQSSLQITGDPLDAGAEQVFYVGPSDFSDKVYEGPDNRTKTHGRSWISWAIYKLYSSIPVDYEFLHGDPKQRCPKALYASVKEKNDATDVAAFVKETPTMGQAIGLAKLFAKSSACATEFLGAGHNEASPSFKIDDSHGYDFFEAAVWTHGFLESPPETRLQIYGSPDWNFVKTDEKQGM